MHEVNKDLMLINFLFLDDFDSTFDIGLFMFRSYNFPKRSTAKRLIKFIVLQNIFDFFETFEVLERNDPSVSLCSFDIIHVNLIFHIGVAMMICVATASNEATHC